MFSSSGNDNSSSSSSASANLRTDNTVIGEKLRPAYKSTRSANLDLFFQAVPPVNPKLLCSLLEKAWNEDAEACLKLIFHLGDVRLGGKQDRPNFYCALLWLFKEHPRTFLANLRHVPFHASLKCLLDVLVNALHDDLARNGITTRNPRYGTESLTNMATCKKAVRIHKKGKRTAPMPNLNMASLRIEFIEIHGYANSILTRVDGRGQPVWATSEAKTHWKSFVEEKLGESKAVLREVEKAARAGQGSCRYVSSIYMDFFAAVRDLFVEGLKAEQEMVANGDAKSFTGLFGKWAPSPKGMHDKTTGIADAIIDKLFPDLIDAEAVVRRTRYQKLLSLLREKAEVPEHYVGSGEWDRVNYCRMASRCRLLYGESVFREHDKERYDAFLADAAKQQEEVALGLKSKTTKRVAAGALMPHEIVAQALQAQKNVNMTREANLQWRALVESVAKSRGETGLSRTLGVLDVSGSMSGIPMDVCVALGLLLTEITSEPWRGWVCTFHERPSLVELDNLPTPVEGVAEKEFVSCLRPEDFELGDLAGRARQVKGIDWGGTTNFEAVFDQLLTMAKFHKVPQEQMVETIFCFSDMEFDQAQRSGSKWEKIMDTVEKKYRNAGYTVPKLVFWNLRASQSIPATKEQKNVALLSGFSAGMMKAFLEGGIEATTPEAQLWTMVLANKNFAHLKLAAEDIPDTEFMIVEP